MIPVVVQFSYLALSINIALGVLGLTIILVFHGSAINRLFMRFEDFTSQNLIHKQYHRVFFHFYVSFIGIALIHIAEILMWALFVVLLNLIPSPIDAILFAGSCYTTIGFVSDILPPGWKSLALFIAFTGLFSIAWTTSVMIGMTESYRQAWRLKHSRPHS